LKGWAAKAKQLCEKHYGPIKDILLAPDLDAPDQVALVFAKDMEGVAATSGATITIAASWVKNNPDDFGMVIHELVHVVQSYPEYHPVWLVEGIADYVRFWMFEPASARPVVDPDKAKYTDGYRTTGAFLAWVVDAHGGQVITEVSTALRKNIYEPDLWSRVTGHDLDELWNRYTAALRGQAATADKRPTTEEPSP
jgi:hypothetical protein